MKNSLEIIIKQVRLEGGFKRGCRIKSGGVECLRQTGCSKQMGQHKKKIFHQMFLCCHVQPLTAGQHPPSCSRPLHNKTELAKRRRAAVYVRPMRPTKYTFPKNLHKLHEKPPGLALARHARLVLRHSIDPAQHLVSLSSVP